MSTDLPTIYYQPKGCNCDNKDTYDQSQIHAACAQALNLLSEGETVGSDKYPHVYNDYERFKFEHAEKPYMEFPIMPNGQVYTGNVSPGTDRIVVGSIAEDYSSAVYCATITHLGATKHDGFVECKDDTVNPNGHGTWDTNKTEGRGREPEHGRKLLKPEQVKLPWFDHRHHESHHHHERDEDRF